MTTKELEARRQRAANWYIKELWGWNLGNIADVATEEDRKVFLKTILIAANGDGILAPEEREWVVGRAAAMGAPDELLRELEAYEAKEDIVEVVSQTGVSNKSRRTVIYSAIKAAAADGVYHDGEKKEIRRAANAMGISEEVVEELEKLHAEEERIKEKRVQLCFPDGAPFAK